MSDVPPDNANDSESKSNKRPRTNFGLTLLFLLGIVISFLLYLNWVQMPSKISLSYFENLIQGKDFAGKPIVDGTGKPVGPNIERIQIVGEQAYGVFKVIPPAEPAYDANGNQITTKRELKKQ